MFVYDLVNYNIVCPELLPEISIQIPYQNNYIILYEIQIYL